MLIPCETLPTRTQGFAIGLDSVFLVHSTLLPLGWLQLSDEHVKKEGSGKHRFQLKLLALHGSDFRLPGSRPAAYIEQSAFGLIGVYNKLPGKIVETTKTVSAFQSALQELVLQRALAGCSDWELTLSPRMPSWSHPLNTIH